MGSPSSKAQSAANNEQQLNDAMIQKAIAYTNTAATNTQNAIANAGPNPYFGAAEKMSPTAYKVDPNNTVNFGEQGPPGTTQGAPSPFSPPTSLPQPLPQPKPRDIATYEYRNTLPVQTNGKAP